MQQEKTLKGFELRVKASNSDVTGTCYILEVLIPNKKTEEYLVDCGTYLEPETKQYNGKFLFNPKKIRAVFLTHYHVDHYGQIPVLYEQGFTGKVYSSEITIQALKKNAMSNFFAERRAHPEELLYGERATLDMLQNSNALSYETEYKISEHVKIVLFQNQHLKGATMFLIICEYKGNKIYTLFTGDYKPSKFPTGLERYKDVPISIIVEGTYGVQEKPEPKFLNYLTKAIREDNDLLVMATGEGRYEGVLEKIEEARRFNLIPKETKVFIEEKRQFVDEKNEQEVNPNITFVSRSNEKQEAIYEKLPKVIIVSTRGGVTYFLQELVKKENVMILLTNHISNGSRARDWVDTSRFSEITIGKEIFQKNARIIEVRDFCGHAYVEDIWKFLNNFTNIVALFIGHGDKESKRLLVNVLAKKINLQRSRVFILRRKISYSITMNTAKYYK